MTLPSRPRSGRSIEENVDLHPHLLYEQKMRVELVSPAVEESARLTPLALATLAALTPPDIDVGFSNDQIRPIDLHDSFQSADLVAISVMSKTAYRAYEIAEACRERGIKVILGGIHPTILPEEASAHADAAVMGEAEILWPRVLADFQANRLQRFYRQEGVVDMDYSPLPRRGIFKFRSRSYIPLDVVQTTRGCPFHCDFCTVNPVFGSRFRMRKIEKVVAEVQGLTRWGILFADDNVLGHGHYFQELFTALEPLKLRWIGEASLAGLDSEQNLKILQKSGCKALFIGFESLSPQLKTIGPGNGRLFLREGHVPGRSFPGPEKAGGDLLPQDFQDASGERENYKRRSPCFSTGVIPDSKFFRHPPMPTPKILRILPKTAPQKI